MKPQTNIDSDDILIAIADPQNLSEGIDTDPLIVQASSSKSATGLGKISIWGLGENDTLTGGLSALHNLYLANQLLLGLTN